ncbi:neuropeptides capa receptor-like [Ptychodera flava]|uniref:neuropeptides capa receptor-like n=1 Tax=Ptychodera flava TaxID=63121 RepID=UPI003969C85C
MASNDSDTTGIPNSTILASVEPTGNEPWLPKLTDHVLFSEQVWVKFIYGSVAVTGIVGNSVVIATILKNRFLKINTYYFILSLALADVMACVTLIPVKVFPMSYVPSGFGGEILCRLVVSEVLMWSSVASSGFHLGAIALEKYIAIVHPYKYINVTRKRTLICIFTLWSLAIASETYLAFIYEYDDAHCIIGLTNTKRMYVKISAIAQFFFFFLAPTSLMFFSYVKMFRALNVEDQIIRSTTGPSYEMEREKFIARKNVVKMLATVVVTFFCCHLANQVYWFGYNVGLAVDLAGVPYNITVMLSFANSCMNPFIYAIKYRKFRDGMRYLFCNSVSSVAQSGIPSVDIM